MIINRKSIINNFRFVCKIVLLGFVLAIVLRIFFLASFKIPTQSMQPAVELGDFILVSKQIPGPRIIQNLFSSPKNNRWEVKRLKGVRKIKRNDVLVFNFPYTDKRRLQLDLSVNFLKRCVAIPGDTFYIENGIYKVKNCPDILGNREVQQTFSQQKTEDIPRKIYNCFPFDSAYNWNVKSFGPLYVPKKGDTIGIDSKNILLYRNLIRYETHCELRIENDTVWLGGEMLQTYAFRQNYYFMAGDRVFDSQDSRYWGLLPEDLIVGKAAVIWQSKDKQTGKRRWERCLKKIQ